MLTARVIPCLDVKDGRVVKGINFVSLRDAGDPVEQARIYDRAGAAAPCFPGIPARPQKPGPMPGRPAAQWHGRRRPHAATRAHTSQSRAPPSMR